MIVIPKRLSDEIASRVRALIEEQNLEAGMKLPAERQLALQLGVSRNSCAGEAGQRRRAGEPSRRRDICPLAARNLV